jgi:3-dehydroquinate synthase
MITANKTSPVQECTITIPYRYPVLFTHGVFDQSNPVLAEALAAAKHGSSAIKVRLWFDEGLATAQPDLIDRARAYFCKFLPEVSISMPATFPGGEAIKNGFQYVDRMIEDLQKEKLCRHSYLVAVGGGAFLDAAGFSAALFHRGVRLIRLPSTTLSQDDSGVGVKNGVNLGDAKNILGTFAPPHAVINDLNLLDTLEPAVLRDGISEAFKVAIIKDPEFFKFLCENAEALGDGERSVMHPMIRRCAEIHMEHIASNGDPFEMGSARPLDFGHWAAHRLESMSDYVLRHGEGVAIGIALDSYYAMRQGLITEDELQQIVDAIARTGLPIYDPLLEQKSGSKHDVMVGIEQFREHLGGTLAVTLPDGIGGKVETSSLDEEILVDGIQWLREFRR